MSRSSRPMKAVDRSWSLRQGNQSEELVKAQREWTLMSEDSRKQKQRRGRSRSETYIPRGLPAWRVREKVAGWECDAWNGTGDATSAEPRGKDVVGIDQWVENFLPHLLGQQAFLCVGSTAQVRKPKHAKRREPRPFGLPRWTWDGGLPRLLDMGKMGRGALGGVHGEFCARVPPPRRLPESQPARQHTPSAPWALPSMIIMAFW